MTIISTLNEIADLFGASRYAAHSLCLSSDPSVISLYVVADLTIMFSYLVIGGILVANRSSVVRFLRFIFFDPPSLFFFGAFILLCGLSHGTMVLTLYYGVYYLDLFVRCATAGVSAATAYRTAIAFYVENKLPSLVEVLAIPEAPGADEFIAPKGDR